MPERDNERVAKRRGSERIRVSQGYRKGERGRERDIKRKIENEKEETPRWERGGCENAEKRVASEGGTRVDRVAKTTGSQVIIKCNQYFTYFSREAEGRPSIPLLRILCKFSRSLFSSDL